MDLSFSGAGFMGCYYFGVVDCWNKYVPRERVNRVAGASAGSLIAAYYLMDLPLSACLKKIIEFTEDIRRRPLGVFDRSNQVVDVLPKVLDELFPEDAHKRVSGRLYVCMTRLKDMKKIIVNEFETRKDLIDALNCSCFIPVWSGNHVSTYKGVKHIDGGFSDNLPVFDEHTIRVCCFSGATDISPYDRAKKELLSGSLLNTPLYFTFANFRRARRALFPPPADFIVDLLERGFHDTKNFILSNDLIQCDSCYRKTDFKDQPIHAKMTPMITPSATPSISPAGSFMDLATIGTEKPKTGARCSRTLKPSAQDGDDASLGTGAARSSFRSLLHAKLQRCSSDLAPRIESPDAPPPTIFISDFNNNPPEIVVLDEEQPVLERLSGADKENELRASSPKSCASTATAESSPASSSSTADSSGDSEENPRKRARPSSSPADKFLASRRGTTQLEPNQLLVDRFKLAPVPLPSCPPSPNLNRQCTECARLRQEARLDLVEEEIMREAERYRVVEVYKDGGLKSKLSSPIRWLRQLGVKSSYKFESAN